MSYDDLAARLKALLPDDVEIKVYADCVSVYHEDLGGSHTWNIKDGILGLDIELEGIETPDDVAAAILRNLAP